MRQRRAYLAATLVTVLTGFWGAAASHAAEPPARVIASGDVIEARTGAGMHGTFFTMELDQPGLVSVIARGQGDLYLSVLDGEGIPLMGGYADNDLDGDMGAEQVVVAVGEAGKVWINVASHEENTAFKLVCGVVAVPMLADDAPEVDADARSTGAIPLPVGAGHTDRLAPDDGDRADMYAVTGGDGLVVLSVSADAGDLVLQESYDAQPHPAFVEGGDGEGGDDGDVWDEFGMMGMGFGMHMGMGMGGFGEAYSDQDLGGDPAREAVLLFLEPGDTRYITVTSNDDEAVGYTVTCVRVPALVNLAALVDAGEALPSNRP